MTAATVPIRSREEAMSDLAEMQHELNYSRNSEAFRRKRSRLILPALAVAAALFYFRGTGGWAIYAFAVVIAASTFFLIIADLRAQTGTLPVYWCVTLAAVLQHDEYVHRMRDLQRMMTARRDPFVLFSSPFLVAAVLGFGGCFPWLSVAFIAVGLYVYVLPAAVFLASRTPRKSDAAVLAAWVAGDDHVTSLGAAAIRRGFAVPNSTGGNTNALS